MSTFQSAERIDLAPQIGTEFRDVQLHKLDEAEIEEVKQLVADRCVLFFRDQHMTLDEQVEVGRRLGELHIFPGQRLRAAAGADDRPPEVMVVRGDANSRAVPGEGWHSDVSCDERPPALTMLRVETTPPSGGDTVFASMYAAYESLSAPMREFLLGLTAVHSGRHAGPRYGYFDPKADYPENEHPIVRTHPVSGRKALYVNSGYAARIPQLTERESDALLRCLFDHVAYGVGFQTRFHWEPNSLTIWDNRCAQHHAVWDYFPATRHGFRVTTVGERPFQ
ncbi:MAG: TauD/TfdA family dioxygenase [Acidimicrobiales bacterium]|nr:TauD/TfdA family dioxygenase [Acidimicrobiales bacterium]